MLRKRLAKNGLAKDGLGFYEGGGRSPSRRRNDPTPGKKQRLPNPSRAATWRAVIGGIRSWGIQTLTASALTLAIASPGTGTVRAGGRAPLGTRGPRWGRWRRVAWWCMGIGIGWHGGLGEQRVGARGSKGHGGWGSRSSCLLYHGPWALFSAAFIITVDQITESIGIPESFQLFRKVWTCQTTCGRFRSISTSLPMLT